MASETPPLGLTRELLFDSDFREQLKKVDPEIELIPVEQHRAAIAALLAERQLKDGVWLFAYGSLIWNPLITFVERRIGKIHGYHRSFCLWTRLGRGSPECPGLTLGLDRGGACRGVVYRIAEEIAADELELVWRREMLTNAYDPQWVKVVTEAGPVEAIAFLINRAHPRYAADVSEEQIVRTVATAKGAIGECASYLFSTVEHLEQLGIRDRTLARIKDKVAKARQITDI